MREAAFVNKNKEKWQLFEDVLYNKAVVSPDKLSDLYVELTDDLSYAKTFYPKGNTVVYLNSIASAAHQKIYKTKKKVRIDFLAFLKLSFHCCFINIRSNY